MTPERRTAILTTLAGSFALAFFFLPWGSVQAHVDWGYSGGAVLDAANPLKVLGEVFAGTPLNVNGWSGRLQGAGITLDNYLIPIASALLIALVWLRATSVWSAPPFLTFALGLYGLLHLVGLGLLFLTSAEVTLRTGWLLSLIAWVVLFSLQGARTGADSEAQPEPIDPLQGRV